MGKQGTRKSRKRATESDADQKTDEPAVEETRPEEEGLEQRMTRLQADFENYRKRVQRDRNNWYQQANEDLIAELLPVLDHFEMGLHTADKHNVDDAVIDGFRLVYNQLEQTLAKFKLQPIDAEGCDFDPHQHEAITHVPSEEHPADTVIAQTRRGYKLGDKLIRPAQVVVSSGPAGEEDSHEPPPDAPPGPVDHRTDNQ